MKNIIYFTIIAIGFFSCGKIENSNSIDKYTYGDGPSITGTTQFVAAGTILINKCTSCHQHAQWKTYTQSDYITNGLVTSQSPPDSPIYYRNKDATSGPGPHNMPLEGKPTLTANELTTILAWISSF